MKHFLAHLISIILIPLLAPTYLFYIILFYFPQLSSITGLNDKILAVILIAATTTLMPFIVVFILFKLKKIRTLTLDNKEDRVIPQIFSCFIYILVTAFLGYRFGLTNALTLSMVAVTLSVIALTIITPYWKISTHATGAWGLVAIVFVLYQKYPESHFLIPCLVTLFLTISVCFARLYLKVHTPLQVIAGTAMGCVIGYSLFQFFLH
jgi:membrane-associated phospholipid phosphatase